MKPILIIDDDEWSCESLASYLHTEGLKVSAVHDGPEGVREALRGEYALVVVHLLISCVDRTHVLESIRSRSDIPVLAIARSGEENERIEALEKGADDCLPNSFDPKELKARIGAILRRAQPNFDGTSQAKGASGRLAVDDIQVDTGLRVAYREGIPVQLTSVEFNILSALLGAAGSVISREELATTALGRSLGMNDRSIDVHISSLRKKLGRHPSGIGRIRTVRNWGYLYAQPQDSGHCHGSKR